MLSSLPPHTPLCRRTFGPQQSRIERVSAAARYEKKKRVPIFGNLDIKNVHGERIILSNRRSDTLHRVALCGSNYLPVTPASSGWSIPESTLL